MSTMATHPRGGRGDAARARRSSTAAMVAGHTAAEEREASAPAQIMEEREVERRGGPAARVAFADARARAAAAGRGHGRGSVAGTSFSKAPPR